MGHIFSRKPKVEFIILGLESSGKTSIVNNFVGVSGPKTPTISFKIHKINHKNLRIKLWDVGGHELVRPIWPYYSIGKDVVFVVDCSKPDQLQQAKDEFNYVMEGSVMRKSNILLLANKQDLPNAMKAEEVVEAFGLAHRSELNWRIEACSAMMGLGINQGFEWLISQHKQ